MEIMYPFIIYISIPIILILIFLKLKQKSIYKDGTKVANTQYIKNTSYYKSVLMKYKIFSHLVKIACLISVFLSLFLVSRPVKTEIYASPLFSRDIFLCMDVSTSVNELNGQLVKDLKKMVNSLKGERFGISIFNSSSVLLVPLTDDYDYVLNILNTLDESFKASNSYDYSMENFYIRNYISSGTLVGAEDRR